MSPPAIVPIETTRTSSPYFSPNSARGARLARLLDAHQAGDDGLVGDDDAIGDVLDRGDLLRRDRLGMGDVEAQPVGRDQRALLRDVVAEHDAQRLVQQMGGRVVGARGRARFVVDLQLQRHADLQRPLLDLDLVDEEVAELLLGVEHRARGTPPRRLTPTSPTWPPDSP